MATTKFYDMLFSNGGVKRAFHIENANSKAVALNACHKALLAEFNAKYGIDTLKADHVSYEFDGVIVTSLPIDSALLKCAQDWKLVSCKIHKIPGRYTHKRNADGSKKRKRDQNKQDAAPKQDATPKQDAAPALHTFPNGASVSVAA